MKTLPYLNQVNKNITSIDTFAGLNKGFRIAENELAEDLNMCSDDYPALSVRRKRQILKSTQNDNGTITLTGGISSAIIINGMLAILTKSGVLYYDDNKIKLDCARNKIIRLGNRLFTYPDGVLINLPSEKGGEITVEKSKIKIYFGLSADDVDDETECVESQTLFLPVRISAADRTYYGTDAPTQPNAGDYWYSDTTGLQMYGDTGSGENGWIGAEPDGIVICLESGTFDFTQYFKMNDAVFIIGTDNESLDRSFIVSSVDEEKIILNGYLEHTVIAEKCLIEKKMPANLEFVIEHNNRLWGCFCGYAEDGKYYNEIYASALNDPTNWYRYDGTVSQSFTVSCVSEGKFTGVAVVNGYVTFFRESCMHRIYGDSPSNFQLVTYECAGIQEGCENSFAGYNGTYFYKSNTGIMQLSDGYPIRISENLGYDEYSDAVGGTDGRYYYVSMKNSDDEFKIFSYDLLRGIWHCEDSPENIKMFFYYGNHLFAVSEDMNEQSVPVVAAAYEKYQNETDKILKIFYRVFYGLALSTALYDVSIYSFTKNKSMNIVVPSTLTTDVLSFYDEDDVEWNFETGNIGYSYCYAKYIKKLYVRMYMEAYSRVDIEILYDSDGEWQSISSVVGTGRVTMHNIQIRPQRCDHFKLRLTGYGDIKILSITQLYEEGSDTK